jgi:hypothetical protein
MAYDELSQYVDSRKLNWHRTSTKAVTSGAEAITFE